MPYVTECTYTARALSAQRTRYSRGDELPSPQTLLSQHAFQKLQNHTLTIHRHHQHPNQHRHETTNPLVREHDIMHSTTTSINGMARRPSINILIKRDIIGFRPPIIIVAYSRRIIPERITVRRSLYHNHGLGRRIDADALDFGRGVVVRGRAVRHAVGEGGGAK